MSIDASTPSPPSPQDGRRIRRKPPPPFPYSHRYPEPDPNDPFAPLSVLRNRTASMSPLSNPSYNSPLSVSDDVPRRAGPPRDLASFVAGQRKKSAFDFPLGDRHWQGYTFQLRKGSSLGLHEYSSDQESSGHGHSKLVGDHRRPGASGLQRHESRRRSQSVFALRSGTFSFISPKSPTPSKRGSETRQSSSPSSSPHLESPPLPPYRSSQYSSSASALSSSSSSSLSDRAQRAAVRTSAAYSRRTSRESFVSAYAHEVSIGGLHRDMHVLPVDMPPRTSSASPIPVDDVHLDEPALPHSPPPPPRPTPPPQAYEPEAAPASPTITSRRFSHASTIPPTRRSSHVPTHSQPLIALPIIGPAPRPASLPPSPIPQNTFIPPVRPMSPPPNAELETNENDKLDDIPLPMNFHFPKHKPSLPSSVESEPESISLASSSADRGGRRLSRMRAVTGGRRRKGSGNSDTRRFSTSGLTTSPPLTPKQSRMAEARDRAQDYVVPSSVQVMPAVSAPTPQIVPQAPRAASPLPLTLSPPSRAVSPTPLAVLPPPRAVSPVPREVSPAPPVVSSTPRRASPPPRTASPVPRVTSPVSQVASPTPPVVSVSTAESSQMMIPVESIERPKPSAGPIEQPKTTLQRKVALDGIQAVSEKKGPLPPRPVELVHPAEPTLSSTQSVSQRSPVQSQPEPVVSLEKKAAVLDASRRSASAPAPPPRPLPSPPGSVSPPPSIISRTTSTAQSPPAPAASTSSHHRSHGSSHTQVHIVKPAASPSRSVPPAASRTTSSPSPPPPPPPPPIIRPVHSHSHSHPEPHVQFHAHSHSQSQTPAPGHEGVPIHTFGGPPTAAQLAKAAHLHVVKENGVRVPFGDLWKGQRTIVVFIRHFWCPLCQDYLSSVMRDVNQASLQRAGVNLVVVGCGSYGLIKSYRQIFHLPYQLYTDASPGQELYHALGMGVASPADRQRSAREEKSPYVRHGSVGGLAMVVRNALRVGMPVWERGGDVSQLGGEFVFGPGLTCAYAHRMQTPRSHAPITEVLAAAGVKVLASRRISRNISLPLERDNPRGASPPRFGRTEDVDSDGEQTGPSRGRQDKALSIVREEAGAYGFASEDREKVMGHHLGSAGSIYSVGWDSNASGESGVIVSGHGRGFSLDR